MIQKRTMRFYAWIPIPINGRLRWLCDYLAHQELDTTETWPTCSWVTVSRSLPDDEPQP